MYLAPPENATGALRYATEAFCHSERSEESLILFVGVNLREIPRSARFTVNVHRERNDKINCYFRGLELLACRGKNREC